LPHLEGLLRGFPRRGFWTGRGGILKF
jgi:hypothetical protein